MVERFEVHIGHQCHQTARSSPFTDMISSNFIFSTSHSTIHVSPPPLDTIAITSPSPKHRTPFSTLTNRCKQLAVQSSSKLLAPRPKSASKPKLSRLEVDLSSHKPPTRGTSESPILPPAPKLRTIPLPSEGVEPVEECDRTVEDEPCHELAGPGPNDSYPSSPTLSEPPEVQRHKAPALGPFQYLKHLQSGGHGEAATMRDMASGRVVCMKIFTKSVLLERRDLKPVTRELASYKRIAAQEPMNPFLMECHCALQDKDSIYFAMDLMETDLMTILIAKEQGGRVPAWIAQAVRFSPKILNPLQLTEKSIEGTRN
ncbi:hypothetical protein JAAARDRAFT_303580 [Jaapia argillacea MUCL 33604]|uniref:non-specific serine/threonine protein kinase n=1 Tax=Jaapia argillacea MUCL 33604 TaxID=933084 RepID=A0A067Q2Q0_9AGAM|nr:hypothetical protein JAAARDRAFT_303580 [Jaapia argillacea MUCL 33604]